MPKVDQWNVAVQQQLGANTALEIAYVGNHAERIYPGETEGFDLNAPVLPSSPAEIASGDIATRRPFFNKFNAVYNGAPAICCSNGMSSVAPVFNHPVLDLPNASGARCVDCSDGGVITNTGSNVPMRQLQFAFRVEF